MNHCDEHTLELFVLQSETVQDRRGEIERHLAVCHGCRSLATDIEQFYRDAETLLGEAKQDGGSPGGDIVPSRNRLEPYYEPYSPPAPYRPHTIMGRFRWAVRRHPIASGLGGFALAAAIVSVVLFRAGSGPGDKNPAYTHINAQSAALEVYNSGYEKLWEIPSRQFYQVSNETYERFSSRNIVTDLDGDGFNEVIATIDPGAQTTTHFPLAIFSSEGRLKTKRYFMSQLAFRGVSYPADMMVEDVLCHDFGGERGKEIFVVANGGRSPNSVFRLSVDGTILGEYVHFGLGTIAMVTFPGSGGDDLLFFGQNDVNEPDSISFPVMIVLDPGKITGRSEAGDSRGFSLPPSSAEKYIVRFPLTDMNELHHSNGHAAMGSLKREDDHHILEMAVRGTYDNQDLAVFSWPMFYYYFDSGFNVLQVKYQSATMNHRRLLIEQGKLRDVPVEDYLADLKDGVMYWNGTGWQKEVTSIQRKPDA